MSREWVMTAAEFVHLRVHSEFSLRDGLVRIDPLMQQLQQLGMHAVAVTDYCNLFAAVKVFKAAIAHGVKPIFGAELPIVRTENATQASPMVLLCQNETGYRNLTQLVSRAYLEGQYQGEPRVMYSWLAEHADGLIALSGGLMGEIGWALLADDESKALALAQYWMDIFPQRFYLEIQRTGRRDESAYNERLVKLADHLQLPLVATQDVCFLRAEEFDAHEARVCIHEGYTLADPRRPQRYSKGQYLCSAEEMQRLFADLPQALQNSVEISKRCTVKLQLGKNYLPNFPVPEGLSIEVYLTQLAEQGLARRMQRVLHERPTQTLDELQPIYTARLHTELSVINPMGFAGYFLIVADFIRWAKENGVPVGPGRGSGAGSLVAYVLDITDLDPLQYDLLFERFLNPERVSMPDFDIDFCVFGRDRVIEYVALRYGRESVSQIITFGTMAAKAVIRDVGRVLGHPYGFVDKIAKLIPFELGMTLERALEQEPELLTRYQTEEEVTELINLARALEGLTRNAGKHAGGVVMAPTKLTDFTAIYCEQGSTQRVSQFDKDDVEAVGLVKFDFLGLRTLTIIDWALKTINAELQQAGAEPIDISLIALDDLPTFELIKACQTTAVFQVESRGMKELIHRLQPDCFEDLIALVALFRPGPLQSGMVDDFINRKHGRAKVLYPHPDLEPILKPTYGVILYQEQVMQIAQSLANYTLGAADLLRRAMGKKKAEEMANQRAIFTSGAVARGVDEGLATTIFDLMEKFAGYGFNKSHSAAYALLAYQTAWLKAHYPAAFMAAVISADMDNTDKVVTLVQECRQMGLTVLPPSIRRAHYRFTVLDSRTIIYGLGAIKGLGEGAVVSLIEARDRLGEQNSLFEFCRHMDLRRINRRVLDALIKSGSFDDWGVERASLQGILDKAIERGQQFHHHQDSGQGSLFAEFDEAMDEIDITHEKPWTTKQRLAGEKETLGFYLSGHPADEAQHEFGRAVTALGKLKTAGVKKALVCGVLNAVRRIVTKSGKRLAILALEDASGRVDCVVFSEIFDNLSMPLVAGEVIAVEGEVGQDDFSGGMKLTAQGVYSVSGLRNRLASHLALTLTAADATLLPALQGILSDYPGECEVRLTYRNAHAEGLLTLSQQWRVVLQDELLARLQEALDPARVKVCYY
jgi:DNA polymerase-3 subunit alpha